MKLTPVQERFILHWGEMGTRWGINRTVAQIYALLFVSPKPLDAEEIAETLTVARSNVSTSIKELQGWGIVRMVHVMGERRDHFEALRDVWETFRLIVDERKKRECDPTLMMLRDCVADSKKQGSADEHTQARMLEMLSFFELMSQWVEQTRKIPTPAIVRTIKLGDKVIKLLGLDKG